MKCHLLHSQPILKIEKKIINKYYYRKLVDVNYKFFTNILAYLFLMYPISPTQINLLFLCLIRFGFYRKNMKIQSKPIHTF